MMLKRVCLILLAGLLAGCSTPTYEDGTARDHSDIPWNTPQSWEGSPGIPGMSSYD